VLLWLLKRPVVSTRSEICFPYGESYAQNSTVWICGLELPARCDIRRLFTNVDRVRVQPNHYTVCVYSPYFEEYIHIASNRPETATPGAPMLLNFSSNREGPPPPT
jgi:hypothetical protein